VLSLTFVPEDPQAAKSMTIRRQALHAREPLLEFTVLLLLLSSMALLSSFASDALHRGLPVVTLMDRIGPTGALGLSLAILSTVTLAWWRYHRRDLTTSPRRIGRRV
jgi:hypothetical protein